MGVARELNNYSNYTLSHKERLLLLVLGAVGLFFVSRLFFKPIVLSFLVSMVALSFPHFYKHFRIEKRKQALKQQFQQVLHLLSVSLSAGRSVEGAFRSAWDDMKFLYPDEGSDMVQELKHIVRRMANGEPIEIAIRQFADRSNIEEIDRFAEIFIVCKRTGGNLIEVMRTTAQVMAEQIQIQQEIQLMLARKKFEGKIIHTLPFIIIAVLSFSSPDYMEPLYTGLGIFIMTGALVMIAFCYGFTLRLMKIEI